MITGNDDLAERLYTSALEHFGFGKTILRLEPEKAVPQNLPPALAETIPQLPLIREGKTGAVICSGFTCRAPIYEPEELARCLR